ncbi:MAG: cytochrome o ubiquinol oxidase subunit IV [Gemmobacter sp.]|uniref:cytochrome o ubiquinol oxidase subunit IV n=1 Tax=Gemmobacter sp. TaxID=1898957 RepID=UPI003919290E
MTHPAPLHPGLNLGPRHGTAHALAEKVMFGFWMFLMSDLILFGLFFATYASMANSVGRAGGPGPQEVFSLGSVAAQTAFLLTSSYTMGRASLALKYRPARLQLWLALSLLLGAGFLVLELRDLTAMIAQGAGPARSGWLSSLFALVGLHGLHVAAGWLWVGVMLVQLRVFGTTDAVKTRLMRLALFWHFLDIIWIGIFSIVYQGGTGMSRDDEAQRDARNYRIGFVTAIALTALPFALVWTQVLPRATALALIGVLALVQVIAQFRFFLHIDLSRQKREDLHLILFSALVLCIVVGGTVWVLGDLGQRMMPGMMLAGLE